MATPSQIAANKINGRKGGPRTEAGKLVCRDNALKHALTSRHLILEEENSAAYESLRADLIDHYQPQNPPEALLVDQFAQSAWRLLRARRLETATFSKKFINVELWMQQHPSADATLTDPDEQRALTFHSRASEFDNIRRHEAAIERAYYRAYRELEKIRKERLKTTPATESVETGNSEIGSVLQPAPDSLLCPSIPVNTRPENLPVAPQSAPHFLVRAIRSLR
jgi:hypothetical protein